MSHPNCLVAAPLTTQPPPVSHGPAGPLSLFQFPPAQLECYHTVGGGVEYLDFSLSDGESLKGCEAGEVWGSQCDIENVSRMSI